MSSRLDSMTGYPSGAAAMWIIALVVVRDGSRFLVVEETRNRGWYLPAGRVEPEETLLEGAAREVREESGLEVAFEGILRIEHTPALATYDARLRVVFVARPVGGVLKTTPDRESLGARWVTLEECARLRLRSNEVLVHFNRVAQGGPIAPVDMLCAEGAPYV